MEPHPALHRGTVSGARRGVRVVVVSTLVGVLILGPVPTAARATAVQVEDPLEGVSLELGYVDHPSRAAMSRDLMGGIEALWTVVDEYVAEHGLTRFPRTRVFLFGDRATAVRVFDRSLDSFSGYARRGAFAVVYFPASYRERSPQLAELAAHEAAHIVQYAIGGTRSGSRCISEGAASWFARRALDELGRLSRGADDLPWEWWLDPSDIPRILNLTTLSQWRRTSREYPRFLYPSCLAAFSVLMETGGGPEAYFDYLAALRGRSWQSAFRLAFDEDLDVFMERIVRLAETDGEDFRLAHEIAFDRFRERYVTGCADRPGPLRCVR